MVGEVEKVQEWVYSSLLGVRLKLRFSALRYPPPPGSRSECRAAVKKAGDLPERTIHLAAINRGSSSHHSFGLDHN